MATREKKLKVWAINSFYGSLVGANGRNQVRLVVATTSQKKAAELTQQSLHHFRGYASETGNALECKAALNQPNQVFWRTLDEWGEPLKPVPALPGPSTKDTEE